jgi:magnesium transporter
MHNETPANAISLPATDSGDRHDAPSASHEFGQHLPTIGNHIVGQAPGIEHQDLAAIPAGKERVVVTCLDYSSDRSQLQDVTERIPQFLAEHRPAWTAVRWIDIDGISDPTVVAQFAEKYELHPLAVDAVMHVPQRPKVEDYPATSEHHPRLFVLARMVRLVDNKLYCEQISMFLGRNTVLTFQESPGDVWDPIRQRLTSAGSRLRNGDASFLLYTLIDAIVDQFFPILEHYSGRLEDLEDAVLETPSRETMQQVHAIKRELLLLRRAAWPMRDAIHQLYREPHECISDQARTYLRDAYDHAVRIIDLIETYREFAASLTETYMASVSQRLNEVMKVLTIMGTVFMPLSFLAGVYGMNMDIPESHFPWAYAIFWSVCATIAVGMLIWFKRRGWLDD